jgi:hypothetical protein
VVAGKRKASSAPLAQGHLRSLNGASHFVGPSIYREGSLAARLRFAGVGWVSIWERILLIPNRGFLRDGAGSPCLRVLSLSPWQKRPETGVSPRGCRPGTRHGWGETPFSPIDTPLLPSLAPVGRQGRSGINSESSSGFMPHRTLRLPGRDRPLEWLTKPL